MNRRIIYTGSFVLLLAFAVFSSIKLSNVEAMGDQRTADKKIYISYEIQPGDTLTSIAKEYTKETNISLNTYIDEVKENNKLSGDRITTGKKLIIAQYSFE